MFFSSLCGPLAWAALAAVCAASPTPLDVSSKPARDEEQLAVREALAETIRSPHLEKRLSADFSMDRSWQDEVLFSG